MTATLRSTLDLHYQIITIHDSDQPRPHSNEGSGFDRRDEPMMVDTAVTSPVRTRVPRRGVDGVRVRVSQAPPAVRAGSLSDPPPSLFSRVGVVAEMDRADNSVVFSEEDDGGEPGGVESTPLLAKRAALEARVDRHDVHLQGAGNVTLADATVRQRRVLANHTSALQLASSGCLLPHYAR